MFSRDQDLKCKSLALTSTVERSTSRSVAFSLEERKENIPLRVYILFGHFLFSRYYGGLDAAQLDYHFFSMFKSCVAQGKSSRSACTRIHPFISRLASRCLASSSRAELHTSAVCRAKPKAPKKTVSKLQAKVDRKHAKDANRLYVVLGSEYNKDDKWIGCDLQKTILTPSAVYAQDAEPRVLHLLEGEVNLPSNLSFGIEGGEEKKLLFEVLPTLTVERGVTSFDEDTVERTKAAMKEELQKANIFARLVDLRNANAKGLAYENHRRIIAAFSPPEQPNDTGRPEVQGTGSSSLYMSAFTLALQLHY